MNKYKNKNKTYTMLESFKRCYFMDIGKSSK